MRDFHKVYIREDREGISRICSGGFGPDLNLSGLNRLTILERVGDESETPKKETQRPRWANVGQGI
jgi:hypothetical protein